jgi:hypothetical protein
MTHVPVIYEKKLLPKRFPGKLGLPNKTRQADNTGFTFQLDQVLVHIFTNQGDDPLPPVRWLQSVNLLIIVMERKFDVRISKSHPLELRYNVPEFGCIGFQEFSADRNIVEKVFNRNMGSFTRTYRLL